MTDDTTQTRDPADIERDIRQTQDEMSRTVDRIGDQLNARSVINALLDKAETNNIDARTLLDGARRNPIALAMIAGGAIWLASDSDAKLPAKLPSFGSGKPKVPEADTHHRDYVAHMERVEMREGEDPLAYQRRRDIARANYLMVERGHDEDESGFRQRLDDAAEAFRKRRHAWADQGRQATDAVGETARSAATKAQDLFTRNPLIGGLAAAAVGAIAGTLLPLTETEETQLAGIGQQAQDLVSEQKDKLTEAARDKKDQLVQKAQDAAQPQTGQQGSQSGAGQSSHANDQYQPSLQEAASQSPPQQPGAASEATATPKQYT